MTDDHDDPRLRGLLTDAVADVVPREGLTRVRARTARPRRRRRFVAGGTALVAAAAAVTAVAVLDRGGDPGVVDGAVEPAPSESTRTLAVYYVGAGPDGPDAPSTVLYRYFESSADAPLDLLMQEPTDPDYRTLWPEGSLVGVPGDGAGTAFVAITDGALRSRPREMSRREAELAVQQVVYTLQADAGERVAVQFLLDGNPVDQVYGVPTSEPLTNAPQLDVLSHLSISDPAEGATYDAPFTARGRSNGFEASVFCQLLDGSGTEVWSAPTTATGWLEERLYPWEVEVDLAGVAPGAYRFACRTDDPTGGTEGRGSGLDTRTIVVE